MRGTRGSTRSRLRTAPWDRNELWRRAQAIPSLDQRFAEDKSLVDHISGQNLITFTRASSATFVGSNGVLRTAVTNLLLRSEEFDNASWGKTRCSVTANAIAAPNGTISADKIVEDGSASSTHLVIDSSGATTIAGRTYVYSVFAKAAERSWVLLSPGGSWGYAWFNLGSGTVGTVVDGGSSASASIVAVGDGWFRCAITATAVDARGYQVLLTTNNNVVTYTGDGTSGLFLWGAQLEQSTTVGEYVPTRATINSAPRFDHNPLTGESLGLLVEEQRTNLALYSQAINVANWGAGQAAFQTLNAATSPDGGSNATLLTENTQNTNRFIGQVIGVTNTTYTVSIFAKAKERRRIMFRENTVTGISATFDLQSGTVAGSEGSPTTSIQSYGNGWYRCVMTYTPSSTSTRLHTVFLMPDSGTSFATSSYAGDGVSGLYLFGFQVELGATPTSYIPTTTAAVTRAADVASITGSNFSSWYRQDEGTMFVEAQLARQNATPGAAMCGIETNVTNAEAIYMHYRGSGETAATVFDGGALQADFFPYLSAVPANTVVRQAIGVRANDMNAAGGGVIGTADTSCTMPTPDRMLIGFSTAGNNYLNGHIRRLTYWPQRLPNNILQSLTS